MAHGRSQEDSIGTLLIFPPVWTPVTPYLALPLLVGYLRAKGLRVSQYDASLDFFTQYLLNPDTLLQLMETVTGREKAGDYSHAGEEARTLLWKLNQDPPAWEKKIGGVRSSLETLRDKDRFYDPKACIRAQAHLYDLLSLASLAHHPSAFTFNTYLNPKIDSFDRMVRICDDARSNPFLKFYSQAVVKRVEAQGADLIGISISTSHQLVGGLTLARCLKKAFPSLHITLGGKHIQRLQQSFRRDPRQFSRFCDSMILDNGERPLEKLIRALSVNGSLEEVPNLVHCQEGKLIFNGNGPHAPISSLPVPDFGDLPLNAYLAPTPIIPVRLSEGCYWGKCTFCSRYDTKRFQTVSPEVAVTQLETLHNRYGVSCFTVNDDCLTPTYLEALSKAIIKRGLRFQLSLWCKPVATFTRNRLRLLSEAGVRLIRWGLETGHPRILKLMNKGTRLPDTLRVLRDATDAGIWNHATVILGFPTESLEEGRETIRFLHQNQDIIHSSILFKFVLLSHSHIFRHPEAFGIEAISEETNPFSYSHRFECRAGMGDRTLSTLLEWAQKYRLEEMYGHPLWFHLRIREYLLLFVSRHGLEAVRKWKVKPADLSIYPLGSRITYHFQKPQDVSPEILEKIRGLIHAGGAVGRSWIQNNLQEAFLIGYAVEQGRIIGVMTHKHPLEGYVKEIEKKTHLDLSGYLERGYSYVRPEYRSMLVGDGLVKGLVAGSPGRKIYVTIRMDNVPAIKLTRRNQMSLAATYHNDRTGHEIGVFTNQ
jgi:hypothetical protein